MTEDRESTCMWILDRAGGWVCHAASAVGRAAWGALKRRLDQVESK